VIPTLLYDGADTGFFSKMMGKWFEPNNDGGSRSRSNSRRETNHVSFKALDTHNPDDDDAPLSPDDTSFTATTMQK